MEGLVAWLVEELKDPAKAAMGGLGSFAVFIFLTVWRAVRSERKRRESEEASIPPIKCSPPESLADQTARIVAEARRSWDLEAELAEAKQLIADLKDDGLRNAIAITRLERDKLAHKRKLDEAEARARALQLENESLREEIDQAFSRVTTHSKPRALPPPLSLPPQVVEVDDRIEDKPTPTENRARIRPRPPRK